ncbi:MAG: AI-2E family transporter [Campylobacterota bacterium]|nr:AI-2E family transporter [Campylobacterota bacterium]
MASVIIVLAGVKSASEIIVSFLLSLFMAIILSPTYNFFNKKALPNALSLTLVMGIFIIIITLVVKLIGSSAQEFQSNIGFYTQQLSSYYSTVVNFASKFGIEISVDEISSMINPNQVMSFSSSILQSIGGMFTNGFVVLFTVAFMLLESSHFIQKIEFASRGNNTNSHIYEIASKIKEYMVLKALISLLTGFVVWIALVLIGTDYAFLWAVIAFLFNFIPNIGSIIAAVPVILLTLVQLGSFSAMMVMAVYVLVNVIIGSVIEPKVMGKGLGLSTLVVFLSLIFWGWLLGIVGMLLSIPLTIMLKIVLDANEDTKSFGVILGSDVNDINFKDKVEKL